MTSSSLLRVTAIVALLQFAAHGALFVRAKPTHGAGEIAVVQAMKDHQFDFGGAKRSYWDMYFGYGLEAAFICLVEAILFWQLAGIATVAPAAVKLIAGLFLAANLAHAFLITRYFFVVPLVPDVLIAGLLGWILMRAPA
jgi:ABC-type thiamin/hydroxymethylpyrimidine transport system permease subunit